MPDRPTCSRASASKFADTESWLSDVLNNGGNKDVKLNQILMPGGIRAPPRISARSRPEPSGAPRRCARPTRTHACHAERARRLARRWNDELKGVQHCRACAGSSRPSCHPVPHRRRAGQCRAVARMPTRRTRSIATIHIGWLASRPARGLLLWLGLTRVRCTNSSARATASSTCASPSRAW
jgi:hypothetical protein